MEQLLRPERFEIEPSSPHADAKWVHFKKTLSNFLEVVKSTETTSKLPLLFNYVSSNVYQYISECATYDDAISTLDNLYQKKRSEIYARHCLASRSQQHGENINEFYQTLNQMSKECDFKAVSAEQHKSEYVRDAFIRGLRCPNIRQRLLENKTITLEDALEQARSLELAQIHSASYGGVPQPAAAISNKQNEEIEETHQLTAAVPPKIEICFFCGGKRHPRSSCPAKDDFCKRCGKKGHYKRVCRSKPNNHSAFIQKTDKIMIASVASLECLSNSVIKVNINGKDFSALVDTGSSQSFINSNIISKCNIQVKPYCGQISMANSSMVSDVSGCCDVILKIKDLTYNADFLILKNLCADVLIGHDILKNYASVKIEFKGRNPPLTICSLATVRIPPVSLFENLTPDCKPIATKSRRHSEEDTKIMKKQIQTLIDEKIIEPSVSPWRAQAFLVRGQRKPRMVIDYSQTVNRFTMLDAYPLPRIEEIISKVAKNRIFSTIDLKSAYHQVPILETEKLYTAFEACGQLYQFCRVPFGVTNGVACFQRVIDKIIKDEKLENTYPYLDDVTICGKTKQEHDNNLQKFMSVAKKYIE
jgi:hypothetical protein